jgi:uncharacterized membrane protein
MDVDNVLEEPNWSEQRLVETQEIAEALVTQESKMFEEESITLHHATYHKSSNKLLIVKVNMKNKKVFEKWNQKLISGGCILKKCTSSRGNRGSIKRIHF